jgi:hypothetical protein
MARDRLTFRQRDVTAAIKAVEAAGKSVHRVVVRKDGVEVITGDDVEHCTDRPTDADKRILERMKNALPPKKV